MNRATKYGALCGVIALGLFVFQLALAGAASAHDAPPQGKSACQTFGPDFTWQTSGTATLDNVPVYSHPTVVITSSVGTVVQTPTTPGSNGSVYSFTVSDIPGSTTSIVITSTTTWTDHGGGTDVRTATILGPTDGCLQEVSVSTAPSATAPTCQADGSLVVPAQASILFAGGANGAGPGTYDITATALSGFKLSGVSTWHIVVLARTTVGCETPTPSSSQPTPSTPPSTPCTSSGLNKCLALTGSDTAEQVGIGGGVVAVGLVLLGLARRRTGQH